MSDLLIAAGPFQFTGRLERSAAPRTCAAVEALLPLSSDLLHVRWSGESTWVPMGDLSLGVPHENATRHPLPGQVLIYTGPLSETELLIAYGPTAFASKAGPLAGNHFLTLTSGVEHLRELGRLTLWKGAQRITITRG